ncbi:hypothetical protein QFC20_006291 [Naganishia adeliensis]|uniref:Uncharacterized protein n=1 Tax=Naganishia adeliensis TaxID=92952 RepID=A0ACC2VDK4_9TREE|nr:hypothetical protein QFC20_006291 [Naganishia adeliensis]
MRKCGGGTSAFISSYEPFGCSEVPGKDTENDIAKGDHPKLNRDTTSEALSSAFSNLDYEICVQPLRDLLNNPAASEKVSYKEGPAPAVSGACVVAVMVDEDSQDIYVAHTGDTRAVAGYWLAPEIDSNGVHFEGGWRCEVLTADHSSKNAGEVKKLEQEHPGEENVLDPEYGRLWGALMPTRAFGNVIRRTENPTWWLKELKPAYDPSTHTTPPYVTARPDVTGRSLERNKDVKGQLKFIIAATDGLWDLLSSEEAVGVVATHLAHPQREPVPRKTVLARLLDQRRPSRELCPGPRQKEDALDGEWVCQDDNAATHLIRNAFGASEAIGTAHQMLSLTPPLSRNFRDDVTCSVIFFGPPTAGGEKRQSESGNPKAETGMLTNLLRRWEMSPVGMRPSGFAWKHPLAHV